MAGRSVALDEARLQLGQVADPEQQPAAVPLAARQELAALHTHAHAVDGRVQVLGRLSDIEFTIDALSAHGVPTRLKPTTHTHGLLDHGARLALMLSQSSANAMM
jgi:hypothetical protein